MYGQLRTSSDEIPHKYILDLLDYQEEDDVCHHCGHQTYYKFTIMDEEVRMVTTTCPHCCWIVKRIEAR